MSCLSEQLKAALDQVRAIPDILGLRPYSVSIRVRTWSGERAGLGTKTDTDGYINVGDGYRPRVQNLSSADIIASAGLYTDEDLKVTITPAYVGACGIGGHLISDFDVPVNANPTEIFFNIKGAGHPVNGSWYKKISQKTDSVLTYTLIIRKTAEIND